MGWVCAELSLLASPRTCAMMWTHEVVLFDFSLWSCHFPRLTVRVCVCVHVCARLVSHTKYVILVAST